MVEAKHLPAEKLKKHTSSREVKHIKDTLVIEPRRTEKNYWSDLWSFRELFIILAWRDIAVQYKQTLIGITWAIIRPLLTMTIFTFVFGRIAKLPTIGEVPYPVMVMAGMLPWFLFATILSQASNSLTMNANLIGKVYFPRLIVPIASGVVSIVDFLINLVLLLMMMMYFGVPLSWNLALLPILTIGVALCGIGPALTLAALNVRYRDFRFVIPFIIQLGLYISPVGFDSSIVPDSWRLIYSLNPMVGLIDAFRWCLLGSQANFYLPSILLSVATILLFLWIGIRIFRSTERTFADLI